MSDRDSLAPVEFIPGDRPDEPPEDGIGLCLSGGGYRAMLFHLGALWRLNLAGYLPKLKRISSVSGGSITSAILGLAWSRLAFDHNGVADNFEPLVAQPLRRLAGRTVDRPAVILGLLFPGRASDYVARAYRAIYGAHKLRELPDSPAPRFVINATNLQSGALWRFSKTYMRDWRVGGVVNPDVELAVAVAASSSFPPFLSPTVLHLKSTDFAPGSGAELQREPYTSEVFLTDGGVYDNLGLETVWKRYATVLVSDGGGQMAPQERPKGDWVRHTLRVLDVIDNQVRSLRKRQLIGSYKTAPGTTEHREGAYWGIRTDITHYELEEVLPCPVESTLKLANEPARLARMQRTTQERLVNWGFAVCDAAIRKHVDGAISPPTGFPYPSARVG